MRGATRRTCSGRWLMQANESRERWWRKPVLASVLQSRWLCLIILGVVLLQVFRVVLELPAAGCFFQDVTGLPCPGCGLSRSLVLFVSGDVVAAMRQHALILPLVMLGGLVVVGAVSFGDWRIRFLKGLAAFERRSGLAVLVGAGLALYGCARLLVILIGE